MPELDWLTGSGPVWLIDWLPALGWQQAVEWLTLSAFGFVTGVFGVLVGAGGGFVLVPILRIFFDKDPSIVAGTVLALVAVNSMSGAFAYRYMRLVDRRSAYLFAAAAIPGSVLAPFVLKRALENLPGMFDAMFGILLVALAVRMVTQQFDSRRSSAFARARHRRRSFVNPSTLHRRRITAESGETFRYRLSERWAVLINFVLGFVSSFFGVGGGFLRTPILVYAFGFPVQVAVATSIYALSFYTTAGAATHAIHGNIECLFQSSRWVCEPDAAPYALIGNIEWFPTFIFAGIGLVIGGQVGARLSRKVQGPWVLRLLMLLILAMGVQLVIQGFFG